MTVPKPTLGLLLAALLQACVSPVDITTAYEEEVYLCDDDALYAERVAACLATREAGGDCSGVLSFQGTIDEIDVVVDTELTRTEITTLRLADLSLQRDNVDLFGDAPYFSFVLLMAGVGGPDSREDGAVTADFAPSPECMDGTEDGTVRFSMRVLAGGASQESDLTTGTVTFTRQTPDEHVGTFDGAFRNGNPLRGCFTAFTDAALVEQAEICD